MSGCHPSLIIITSHVHSRPTRTARAPRVLTAAAGGDDVDTSGDLTTASLIGSFGSGRDRDVRWRMPLHATPAPARHLGARMFRVFDAGGLDMN